MDLYFKYSNENDPLYGSRSNGGLSTNSQAKPFMVQQGLNLFIVDNPPIADPTRYLTIVQVWPPAKKASTAPVIATEPLSEVTFTLPRTENQNSVRNAYHINSPQILQEIYEEHPLTIDSEDDVDDDDDHDDEINDSPGDLPKMQQTIEHKVNHFPANLAMTTIKKDDHPIPQCNIPLANLAMTTMKKDEHRQCTIPFANLFAITIEELDENHNRTILLREMLDNATSFKRTRMKKEMIKHLEKFFKINPRPSRNEIKGIAMFLEMEDEQTIRNWFNNRRSKLKKMENLKTTQ